MTKMHGDWEGPCSVAAYTVPGCFCLFELNWASLFVDSFISLNITLNVELSIKNAGAYCILAI